MVLRGPEVHEGGFPGIEPVVIGLDDPSLEMLEELQFMRGDDGGMEEDAVEDVGRREVVVVDAEMPCTSPWRISKEGWAWRMSRQWR
jgi:hypothetical protein